MNPGRVVRDSHTTRPNSHVDLVQLARSGRDIRQRHAVEVFQLNPFRFCEYGFQFAEGLDGAHIVRVDAFQEMQTSFKPLDYVAETNFRRLFREFDPAAKPPYTANKAESRQLIDHFGHVMDRDTEQRGHVRNRCPSLSRSQVHQRSQGIVSLGGQVHVGDFIAKDA